jgi:L-fuconolactonase
VEIIDSQVHIWDADRPERPWHRAALEQYLARVEAAGVGNLDTAPVTYGVLLEKMATAGVDAAVLVTFGAYYELDDSYALEAARQHPDRFRVIGVLDPLAPDVTEQVARFAAQPGAAGLRVLMHTDERREQLREGLLDGYFGAVQAEKLVLCLLAWGSLPEVPAIAQAYPDLQIVIDHMGVPQPPLPVGPDPFAALPDLLALGAHPNVAVKLSGLPTLSRESFPFRDLWPHIYRVCNAFGPERVMWGSDTTRTGLDYGEELRFIRDSRELSDADKELILGRALRQVFRWPAGQS